MNAKKRFDWKARLYHEEKIGGLCVFENEMMLSFLAEDGENVIFERVVHLEPGIIESGVLVKKDDLVKKLRELASVHGLPSRSIILSLSAEAGHPFVFDFFPTLTDQEIEDALQLIVESSLPLGKGKIYADWEEIKQENFAKRKFLLGMGIKSIIDPYLAALGEAGLTAVAVETHPWSMGRSFGVNQESSLTVNIEENQTIFNGYLRDYLIFQFILRDGNERLVEFAAKEKDVLNKAERKRKKSKEAAEPPGRPEEAARFTRRILDFLESGDNCRILPEKLAIFGKEEDRNILEANLGTEIGKKIAVRGSEKEARRLFVSGATKRGILPRFEDLAISFTAVGTEAAYERQRLLSFLDFFEKLVASIGLLFVLILGGTLFLIDMAGKNSDKLLERERLSIPEEFNVIKKDADIFNAEIRRLNFLLDLEPRWHKLFGELDQAVNSGLVVTNLRAEKGGAVHIGGYGKNREALIQFRDQLQKSEVFSSITLPLTLLIEKENIPFSFEIALKDKLFLMR
ncbi:PilN domain-containing protein [Candidatus Wolfebacteria bacterium]|nr:PilN domain-containing protein [Candidatus Wolfebacteria bacterium]